MKHEWLRPAVGRFLLVTSVVLFTLATRPWTSGRADGALVVTKRSTSSDSAPSEAGVSRKEHVEETFAPAPAGPDPARSLATLAVIALAVGLPLACRTMLTDGTKTDDELNVSALRVTLYGVVCLFALMTVRAGWCATSMSDIKIDGGWATVLSTLAAAKALQSFGERPTSTSKATAQDDPEPPAR